MRSWLPTALACTLLPLAPAAAAAQWIPQRTGTTAEFRGLDAVDARVVWASGRGGVVARTVDGGESWSADTIPGAARLFMVDVHAVDSTTAYVLGTDFEGGLSRIYKTLDGGRSWTLQYEKAGAGVFFDGLAFWDAAHGVAFGDPVGGRFQVVTTDDGGATWREAEPGALPAPLPGEAGFAASGRAIVTAGERHAWIGTGGAAHARVLRTADRGRTWEAVETPLPAGPTAGIFTVAFRDSLHGAALGGDYARPDVEAPNVLVTEDGGRSWRVAGSTQPPGVRYGAVYVPGAPTPTLVAVAPSGTGYSTDDGKTWREIGAEGYNTVDFVSAGSGWAAGTDGRIARWGGTFPPRAQ